MRKPDAVFCDLDGSLLGPDKKVGEKDAATIRRLKELGVPVVICTGRPILGVRQVVKELGLDLALCSNGGCCYDFSRGELLFTTEMDHNIARRLLTWLEKEGAFFLLHAPDRIFASFGVTMPAHYLLEGEENGGLLTCETPLEGVRILKILAIRCEESAILRKGKELFGPEELTICSSERGFVDFNPPGVNKGAGIRQLADRMGWRLEEILTLGDNNNDLPMLEAVGMGAAPSSGVPEARAAADFITTASGQNPLTTAIEHFFPTRPFGP